MKPIHLALLALAALPVVISLGSSEHTKKVMVGDRSYLVTRSKGGFLVTTLDGQQSLGILNGQLQTKTTNGVEATKLVGDVLAHPTSFGLSPADIALLHSTVSPSSR